MENWQGGRFDKARILLQAAMEELTDSEALDLLARELHYRTRRDGRPERPPVNVEVHLSTEEPHPQEAPSASLKNEQCKHAQERELIMHMVERDGFRDTLLTLCRMRARLPLDYPQECLATFVEMTPDPQFTWFEILTNSIIPQAPNKPEAFRAAWEGNLAEEFSIARKLLPRNTGSEAPPASQA